MENEFKKIKVHVFQKGNVKINHAIIIKQTDDIVLIHIDLNYKYPKIQGTNDNGYFVSKFEDDDLKEHKHFSFPEFKNKDWDMFSYVPCRYGLRIVLTKKEIFEETPLTE